MSNDTREESRGPGAPKGRRPVIWICEAIVGCTCGNAQLKSEKIAVPDQNPDSIYGLFPQDQAEKMFLDKYNVTPQVVYGPMYDKKGGQLKARRKKGTISRDIADMRLCRDKKQRHGIWEGWHGIANYIENDPEKVYFCFVREVDPDPDKLKKAPVPGKVNIAELVFDDSGTEDNNILVP
ncbi:hypothetical protein LCGC14_0459170 [marine sediment metagenome]|uniref:Uncharacterized protein n=1 Tax=marine sediment metagenome TaxID=412755 RepID=A0A0F9VPD0_9ZZZZ